MANFSPTVRHRRLLQELRQLRGAAGLKQEEVADHLDWSTSRMTKVEGGTLRISVNDVRAMLQLYGLREGAKYEALVQLAKQARERGWWHAYSDVIPQWFQVYVGLEAEASSLRNYEPELVHGLLQTEDYARAVYQAARVMDAPDEIERHVSLRMARQDVITRSEQPMHFWAIMNEAALRRRVGGACVMKDQLRHLVEVSAQPNVTLQVLPYGIGAHAAMLGSFAILSFSEGASEVAYLEYMTGSLYLEKPEEVRAYTLTYDHLRASALDPRDSIAMVAKLVKEDL
ncbi:helix-turn-helix domain-containing protein [Streptosporangium lutulentum]|uniref:Transcriptional regulator with XRE-family HTH domain n=1 Tax=Streptosporangium lutulentum TaxID=1461250 RepID=A0ABT9QSU4_9ACTN|nr:helix-turn-helix transcriptional regulator [Streptosporangium lutulentum]MDP9849778.1 transcriptional regulator with XRE-family HTH domain [Streptosporangium lutulentum]